MTERESPLKSRGWLIDTATIGHRKTGRVEAQPSECAETAAALGLLECKSLTFAHDISPLPRHRFRLKAALSSDVVQACVVSLEPVPARIEETSESELVPGDDARPAPEDEVTDVLAEPVIDVYASGRIDLGRIAFELLSVSLDPFPRLAGVELPEEISKGGQPPSPFAALARLRQGPDKQ